MRVSEDIVPIAEFKTNASRLIRELGQTHRTIIVTHNGRAAAVVLSPEEYDRLNDEQTRRLHLARYRAAATAEATGDMIEDDAMWQEMEQEFGPIPTPDES